MRQQGAIQISKRSFLMSVIILLCLMSLAGFLSRMIPAGHFERVTIEGVERVLPDSWQEVERSALPVYRWFLAPFELLRGPDGLSVLVISLFILFVGSTFRILEQSGVLQGMLDRLIFRYGQKKYHLLAVMVFFFMLCGSVFGIFEEMIALLPFSLMLANSLGWDDRMGMGMSLLAVAFGFCAATFNPFTLGIAQRLAGLPPYSGLFFRILVFLSVYLVMLFFLVHHGKKVDRGLSSAWVQKDGREKESIRKGRMAFQGMLLLILGFILLGFFLPALSEISLPLTALLFFLAGIVSAVAAGYHRALPRDILRGFSDVAPAILLILLAMSVKYIITEAEVIDTILYRLAQVLQGKSPFFVMLSLYFLVLILEFFIGSGSAKAFLVIPLITPLVDLLGITRQSAVQAFLFGDGFSNVFYPTNAALMIALGISGISYLRWMRWTLPLQLAVFLLSLFWLAIAMSIQYGPF